MGVTPRDRLLSGSVVRVLIVDDMWSLQKLVQAYLGPSHRYATASSGAQALSLLDSFRPNLVVSDVRMPDMDGLELCARVRERLGVPVVLMSSQEQDPAVLAAAGAAGFVKKPIDADELVAMVERALGTQKG